MRMIQHQRNLLFRSTALLGVIAGIVFSSGFANAGSIDPIVTNTVKTTSMVTIACTTCPPLKSLQKIRGYRIEDLPYVPQRMGIKEMNREMKMARTQAWMGGSPIVFISKLTDQAAKDLAEAVKTLPEGKDNVATNNGTLPADQPAIDILMTTSAVTAVMKQPSATAAPTVDDPAKPLFEPDRFKLRLN